MQLPELFKEVHTLINPKLVKCVIHLLVRILKRSVHLCSIKCCCKHTHLIYINVIMYTLHMPNNTSFYTYVFKNPQSEFSNPSFGEYSVLHEAVRLLDEKTTRAILSSLPAHARGTHWCDPYFRAPIHTLVCCSQFLH